MDGHDLRQWQEQIVAAFDEGELRQAIRAGLDVELDAIARPGDLGDRVWDVLLWAERTGRTSELLDVVQAERPHKFAGYGRTPDMEQQRQLQEGNGVFRVVGQLEATQVQIQHTLDEVQQEIRFLRWWVTASVTLNGVLAAMLVLHIWT